MLTRRHIRVKVMQSLYAFEQSNNDNINAEEKFLQKSMDEMYDLFLLNLSLFVELKNHAENLLEKSQQKHLATDDDKNPNRKFVENPIFSLLENNERLNSLLEERKLHHWKHDDEYVSIIWQKLQESDVYADYLTTRTTTFSEDKQFVLDVFKEIIAPNDKLYDYLEDKKLTWLDDLPIVNTSILKLIKKIKKEDETLAIPRLFKNMDDRDFALSLLKKSLLNQADYDEDIAEKTPNWDKDRIAEIDLVLLRMAICEFVKFPSIPVKVTINEYLEIAKEYSTPKSSIFINGVLDKLSKEYKETGKLNKIGRGLM